MIIDGGIGVSGDQKFFHGKVSLCRFNGDILADKRTLAFCLLRVWNEDKTGFYKIYEKV